MIGILEQAQFRVSAKFAANVSQQVQIGQIVARALEEQHRDTNRKQVLGSRSRRAFGRMKGKAEKRQSDHARQRRLSLGLGGHAPAERSTPCYQWQSGQKPGSLRHRCSNGCLRHGGRVGSPRASFHVWKLEPQRGDPSLGKVCRHRLQPRVGHAGPRPMRQHIAGPSLRGHLDEPREGWASIEIVAARGSMFLPAIDFPGSKLGWRERRHPRPHREVRRLRNGVRRSSRADPRETETGSQAEISASRVERNDRRQLRWSRSRIPTPSGGREKPSSSIAAQLRPGDAGYDPLPPLVVATDAFHA